MKGKGMGRKRSARWEVRGGKGRAVEGKKGWVEGGIKGRRGTVSKSKVSTYFYGTDFFPNSYLRRVRHIFS